MFFNLITRVLCHFSLIQINGSLWNRTKNLVFTIRAYHSRFFYAVFIIFCGIFYGSCVDAAEQDSEEVLSEM